MHLNPYASVVFFTAIESMVFTCYTKKKNK